MSRWLAVERPQQANGPDQGGNRYDAYDSIFSESFWGWKLYRVSVPINVVNAMQQASAISPRLHELAIPRPGHTVQFAGGWHGR